MSKKQEVIAANIAHPDWTARQIADHIGTRSEYVHVCGYRYQLKFAKHVHEKEENSVTRLGWAAKRAGLTVADIQKMGAE